MRGERIFITGGCGFIGANLVKYLLERRTPKITVYDNLSVGSKINLERAIVDSRRNDNPVEFIEGDILDKNKLSQAIKGHGVVIHLAAHTRVVESLENPQWNFDINVIGTFNTLEAARKNGAEKFIFASSNAAVGEQTPPINEKMFSKPLSPYGASKLFGEGLCSAYFHSYGLKTVSLRFANAYGPYSEHKTSVIAKFIRRTKRGEPLEIYGDGNQTRDFIHACDICQAIYLCLTTNRSPIHQSGKLWGEIFQIATFRETTIDEIAYAIKEIVEKETDKKIKIIHSKPRLGDVRSNFSDTSKAKKILGYEPHFDLHKGLRKTFEYFKNM